MKNKCVIGLEANVYMGNQRLRNCGHNTGLQELIHNEYFE